MGTLADSLFTVLLSWVRALVDSLWAILSAEHTTILEFLGKNWMLIALVIIAAGLVIDWLVWLVRWQPYHLWALRVRRLLRLPPPDEDRVSGKAHAATVPQRTQAHAAVAPRQEDWLPLEQPVIDESQAQDVLRQAESVPDETLGAYPGMRYGAMASPRADEAGTQRYAAIHTEGPGAAEVTRRRAEIDAWQQQIQEEARARAQAELAARQAEQARLAQEAYEAEQARLAQEAYARQMAEYERQKAQYERDLAEYERQKAAYEAELARQSAQQEADDGAQEANARRRRAQSAQPPRTYSDYVSGEAVSELPDPPQWPDVSETRAQEPTAPAGKKKAKAGGGLMSRMVKMIEPEEEEISSIASLPPRVDMRDAYKPAKKPQKRGPRKR